MKTWGIMLNYGPDMSDPLDTYWVLTFSLGTKRYRWEFAR
jgi:hypothetical protein